MHIIATSSYSYYKASVISDSLVISKLVILSPFLYSKGQSKRITLGFLITLLIFGCVISLLNITPSRTTLSSKVPPGIFSTLAYLFKSRVNLLVLAALCTILTAFKLKSVIIFPHLEANLVPIQETKALLISSSLLISIGTANS